jgi:hypothetical protein
MKTAQVMLRPFMGLEVQQMHNTEYFNLTSLAKVAAEKHGLVPNTELSHWQESPKTKAFIEEICRQESTTPDTLIIAKRGKYGGTWAHPLLMVDFAMWLSPEFKYHAVKWAHDNLCKLRDAAGDYSKEMTDACRDVLGYYKPWQYADENNMVNRVASVPPGARNLLTEKQLARLAKIQRANTKLIQAGITSMHDREMQIRKALEATRLFA